MPSAMSACVIRRPWPLSAVALALAGAYRGGDILEYTLDSRPVEPPSVPLYAERVIHGCIYQHGPT